jgi:serine/threonine-protein kinase
MPSIGKYEILEELGSGSMGTVYKGRDTVLDRVVALKTIPTGSRSNYEAQRSFYREARTCARLSHPNIVSVYDLGEEGGTSYIAMELLQGADFRQLIERRQALPLAVKLIAMAQICEGLAYAHREGVIHRDIKPSNLFLLPDGRAKIVDFGIAKFTEAKAMPLPEEPGTPNYMAPEQILGKEYDGRADLFSAAMVFFEFLTFRHPFQGRTIQTRILEDRPDSLFQFDPALPQILERIIEKALARDPNHRYQTGDEFAASLRRLAEALTLTASPVQPALELPPPSNFAVSPPAARPESGYRTSQNPVLPRLTAEPEPERGATGDRKRMALVLGLIAAAAVVMVVLPSFYRTVKVEPFVASARVAVDRVALRAGPADGEKGVASAQRSTLVHVLTVPKSLTDAWVQIQARDGDGYTKAGYVRTRDLTEWEATDPKVALTLARISGPMDRGTDADIRVQIDKLTSVAAQFPGRPEANAATLDAVRLQFLLALRGKEANADGDWFVGLSDLPNRLEPMREDTELKSAAEELSKQIRDLAAEHGGAPVATGDAKSDPQVSAEPPAPTDEELQSWLATSERLRKSYRYNEAKAYANRVLKANPANAQAQELLKKINAAIELENSAK